MSFESEYRTNIDLYLQRLGEVENLVQKQQQEGVFYDPDRRIDHIRDPATRQAWETLYFAPRDLREELIEEGGNPYFVRHVIKNQKIYNLYQKAINKRAAEIEELKTKLDDMKAQIKYSAIENPTGSVMLGNLDSPQINYLRPSHAIPQMYNLLLLRRQAAQQTANPN